MKQFAMFYFKEEAEGEYKLYCDLDGVLCDWDAAFKNLGDEHTEGLTGEQYEEKHGKEKFWKMIDEVGGLEFWSEMPWTKDGKKLWNHIKKFKPTILSAPSAQKVCTEGKDIWIDRELGKDVPRIYEKNKYIHANPESVLIDDYENKIKPWVENDGIGIRHQSADKTIKELKKYGF